LSLAKLEKVNVNYNKEEYKLDVGNIEKKILFYILLIVLAESLFKSRIRFYIRGTKTH
jgi:hypothetical protein